MGKTGIVKVPLERGGIALNVRERNRRRIQNGIRIFLEKEGELPRAVIVRNKDDSDTYFGGLLREVHFGRVKFLGFTLLEGTSIPVFLTSTFWQYGVALDGCVLVSASRLKQYL